MRISEHLLYFCQYLKLSLLDYQDFLGDLAQFAYLEKIQQHRTHLSYDPLGTTAVYRRRVDMLSRSQMAVSSDASGALY